MTEPLAKTVVDTAKYLRAVRPIDPEELVLYVDDTVKESAIRSILRSYAVELELVERDDGTFAPPSAGPVDVVFDVCETFPDRHQSVVGTLLEDAYGPGWADGESGDALRTAIRSFKHAYFAGEAVTYDLATALGYAIYHLPATYATVQYVLDVLQSADLLGRSLRILDVGAGVGGGALAIHDYLPPDTLVDVTALEPSAPAISILEPLLDGGSHNFHWEVRQERIEQARLTDTYDLILLANVLSELESPAAIVAELAARLDPEGSLVMISPADERTSRLLRTVETDALRTQQSLDVFSPTLRLWPGHQPTDACWSFVSQPDFEVPEFQRRLDEGKPGSPGDRDPATGEFVNVDVQYSYGILRADGRRRIDYQPGRSRFTPLVESEQFVGDRVDLSVVKLSHSLSEPEANPLFVIGDGSQSVAHFATLTRATHLNRHVSAAEYGDVLLIQGGLLLWNDDEAAYNVVIDAETTVDRITPDRFYAV